MISGIATALYMYGVDRHALTYYGDATSHLIAARKLFDWKENPGWDQIGTVWLPLPHFLLMFPSLIEELFFTGFAGLAINLPSLVITSVFLYKIISRILSKVPDVNASFVPYIAFAGALVYALNPNFLYFGMTAMTEAPFMLFFVGSAYYFLRWNEEYRDGRSAGLRYLIVCSAFASAATLCRYEGWTLPLVLFASVMITILRRKNVGIEKGAENRKILYIIAVAIVSFSGIGFWLVFNEINYGDPLEFANAQYYSAASQALDRPVRENLFLQPLNVIGVYGITAVVVYGPILLGAAAIGHVFHRRVKEGYSIRMHLFVFLASAPVFTIVSMFIGIGEMTILFNWFNSRFVVLLAPLAIVLAAMFVARMPQAFRSNRALLIGILASLFVFQVAMIGYSMIVTLIDAKNGYEYKQAPFAVQTGEQIGSLYDGNGFIMIIAGSAHMHRIQVASEIPLKNYDSIIQSSMGKRSFLEPWNYDNRWIIIGKEPNRVFAFS